jgi:hypothetical protein
MPSILDSFTPGTFAVWINQRTGECVTRIGHRYKRLAALREPDPGLPSGLEAWSILDTKARMYPWPGSVFFTLDHAAAYVVEVESYIDWGRFDAQSYNVAQAADLHDRILRSCAKHCGVPLAVPKVSDAIAKKIGAMLKEKRHK